MSIGRLHCHSRLGSVLMAVTILALVFLTSPVRVFAQADGDNPYPGRLPAPSLDGGVDWLNTSAPISLRDLRGKIVLLDFWTYCCINCMHILPDLKELEQKYKDQLVVIGVHSAKFANERETENIREAIIRYEIEHPVVNDAEMIIARKYGFASWPTLVLIDPLGSIVGILSGEGQKDRFDQAIGQMVKYHRSRKTLDETPVTFRLEREKLEPQPLRYPGKVLADEAGQKLYISDSNHNRIVVSTFSGELVEVIGTGAIGSADGGYGEAQFDHPQGMVLVDDKLYVADTENHLLRVVDLKSRQVSTLAGTGKQSQRRVRGGKLRQTALNSPWDLTHLDGILYIAMAGPHQLWRHKLGTDHLEVYAGSGQEDIIDGSHDDAALAQPSGIVTDGRVLYHVDSEGSAVRRVMLGAGDTGVTTLVGPHNFPNGRSLFEFGDIDGVGDAVRLQHPIGLAYYAGKLFVADTYNDKIKQIDIPSRTCVTWLGTGQRGKELEPVQLNEPSGLSIANGKAYIADTNNHRLLETDLQTRATREFVVQGLKPPSPPKDKIDRYDGKTQRTAAQTVSQDKPLTVQMNFQLPDGFHINRDAPLTCELAVESQAELFASGVLDQRHPAQAEESSAHFEIPLSGQPGSTLLKLTVSYQYCRDGAEGVCRAGEFRWEIPLTISAGGADQISLTTAPQP